MGRIISIVNNKGGVGKTTIAGNLGHALAQRKKKVLLVDLDNQCNVSSVFMKDDSRGDTIYELFENETADASKCVYASDYENLWILPNVHETAALESEMSARPGKGFSILRDRLRPFAVANFDYVLLDCPPNLGLFAVQAMVAADDVIVPIECGSRFAIDGLERTMSAIIDVQKQLNPGIRNTKLLISRVDKRTSISRITIQQIQKHFRDDLFETHIPLNTAVQQAELLRQTVIGFAPFSNGAHAFQVLAREFERIIS